MTFSPTFMRALKEKAKKYGIDITHEDQLKSVRFLKLLKSKGIDLDKFIAEYRPVPTNKSPTSRAKNKTLVSAIHREIFMQTLDSEEESVYKLKKLLNNIQNG